MREGQPDQILAVQPVPGRGVHAIDVRSCRIEGHRERRRLGPEHIVGMLDLEADTRRVLELNYPGES